MIDIDRILAAVLRGVDKGVKRAFAFSPKEERKSGKLAPGGEAKQPASAPAAAPQAAAPAAPPVAAATPPAKPKAPTHMAPVGSKALGKAASIKLLKSAGLKPNPAPAPPAPVAPQAPPAPAAVPPTGNPSATVTTAKSATKAKAATTVKSVKTATKAAPKAPHVKAVKASGPKKAAVGARGLKSAKHGAEETDLVDAMKGFKSTFGGAEKVIGQKFYSPDQERDASGKWSGGSSDGKQAADASSPREHRNAAEYHNKAAKAMTETGRAGAARAHETASELHRAAAVGAARAGDPAWKTAERALEATRQAHEETRNVGPSLVPPDVRDARASFKKSRDAEERALDRRIAARERAGDRVTVRPPHRRSYGAESVADAASQKFVEGAPMSDITTKAIDAVEAGVNKKFYSDSQERDDSGKWTSGGSGGERDKAINAKGESAHDAAGKHHDAMSGAKELVAARLSPEKAVRDAGRKVENAHLNAAQAHEEAARTNSGADGKYAREASARAYQLHDRLRSVKNDWKPAKDTHAAFLKTMKNAMHGKT